MIDPNRIAVIVNTAAPESFVVARRFLRARRIPGRNVIHINCPITESIPDDECDDRILRPVRDFLVTKRLDTTVDFLVTTRGIPLLNASGYSVDGLLMTLDIGIPFGAGNPYFNSDRPFRHREFYIYLCTRLDGYTLIDAVALIDRSLAARPSKGVFLLDIDPRRGTPRYGKTNVQMRNAAKRLKQKEFVVRLDESPEFTSETAKLAGYFSWGSNDGAFDPAAYKALRFWPGAIAETAVSTSCRTLRPVRGGQSLIADLITGNDGITGIKGYVSEPYLGAVAHPDILFPSYVAGRTLAESFYAASAQIRWKDVVLGDPVCAPYMQK